MSIAEVVYKIISGFPQFVQIGIVFFVLGVGMYVLIYLLHHSAKFGKFEMIRKPQRSSPRRKSTRKKKK